MGDLLELGLFPLDLVLLPGEVVALHLFEPRYRLLFADAVTDDRPIVIQRATDDGDGERVGCAARFVELTRRHPDGRLDVLLKGEFAAEVVSPTGGRLYRSAEVRPLGDAPGEAPARERERLVDLVRRLVGEEPAPEPATPLSYGLAAGLPLEAALRQSLLEERSEPARVAMLVAALERTLSGYEGAAAGTPPPPTNGTTPHP